MSVRISGIINKGKIVKLNAVYDCCECGETKSLIITGDMMEGTADLFNKLIFNEICLDCHTNKAVPKLVECLVN